MAEIRQNILELANHLGRKKMGSKDQILATDPEYLILEPACVTDEMAEVLMHIKIREKVTASEVAKRCNKSVEETHRILLGTADVGICIVNTINNEDVFWYETWVPGIMEMMTNHKENVKKYPQIAYAFEAYGRVRGAKSTGTFPVGVGLMRVIPIQSAIDGNSKSVSYEEVSKYIEDNTKFSVADCSCRTAREVMGEGCGHLKEDMCIQMGHAAEYYIRTGRAREITKQEAYDIIKLAEANGLMHQIPNIDGSGKTHAICNCCGCGCLALRSATMFANADMVRSNYTAKVDKEKCVACGECVKNCPVNALQLGQKLCSSNKVVEAIVREDTPRDTEWGEDRWTADYRTTRKTVVDTGTSPCKTKCPAHISIQGYIKLASQGKYTEALELIKNDNPFPAVCGRICPRGCESVCTRGDIDEPVAIDDIKKFIAEQDLDKQRRFVPRIKHSYDKKIAVIGGGPSGLSCAYYLAVDGYKVTVFEKQKVLGGMLVLGIPSFRLEKSVINAEIDVLKQLGVEFVTGVEVGRDKSLSQLRKEGFKAFYLAVGAQAGRKLKLDGEDCEGVSTGVDFLRNVNLGNKVAIDGDSVVIGGGNVAIDVARTASRLSKDNVSMFCLETLEQMPALAEEVAEAVEEGIVINNSWAPKRILVEKGKVVGMEFKKCVSVFDKDGKFAPTYDEANVKTVKCSNVILSVGQSIEWGNLLNGSKVELNANNTAKADLKTLQSGEEDIFIGGDALTGPRFAIDAIATGKEAAISIHRFVNVGQSLVFGRENNDYLSLNKEAVLINGYDNEQRQRTAHVSSEQAKSFKDMRTVFSEEQLRKETERCLGCGATVVDDFICVGCGQCTTKCKFEAIKLDRTYNGAGIVFEKMKPAVVKNVIKRKIRIATKNIMRKFTKKK